MVADHNPFQSLNGTCLYVGWRLFWVFIVRMLRMQIGLMETSPLPPNHLPNWMDSDSSQLRKGTLKYWTSCTCSEFLALFTLCNTPTLFSFPGNLSLWVSDSEELPESSLSILHQAQVLADCSVQLHFMSNLFYMAWALQSFMGTGDQFLTTCHPYVWCIIHSTPHTIRAYPPQCSVDSHFHVLWNWVTR